MSGVFLTSFKLLFKGVTSLLLKEAPAVEPGVWLALELHPAAAWALAAATLHHWGRGNPILSMAGVNVICASLPEVLEVK